MKSNYEIRKFIEEVMEKTDPKTDAYTDAVKRFQDLVIQSDRQFYTLKNRKDELIAIDALSHLGSFTLLPIFTDPAAVSISVDLEQQEFKEETESIYTLIDVLLNSPELDGMVLNPGSSHSQILHHGFFERFDKNIKKKQMEIMEPEEVPEDLLQAASDYLDQSGIFGNASLCMGIPEGEQPWYVIFVRSKDLNDTKIEAMQNALDEYPVLVFADIGIPVSKLLPGNQPFWEKKKGENQ